ncbi:hypothetical protein EWE75_09715 [Sphingomonas populi]|uniref:Uncharacterized protein n=1 Tax=Sphingomonas populi TaxID=2484750 RepID=A0A4Q6Y4A1_9SPHN|nr:hypothetical protein [Sphingomonas populi]RZF64664.1 hypothetical protein EWE75_09715 [Sphingomonas populi]
MLPIARHAIRDGLEALVGAFGRGKTGPMVTANTIPIHRWAGRISAWRLIGGAYLHFVVPAYFFAMPLAAIFVSPANASIAGVDRNAAFGKRRGLAVRSRHTG